MPDTSQTSSVSSDSVQAVFLWRRKKLSIFVLSVATAIWVLFDVYQFNLITVASWIAISVLTSLFIYGNFVRLFRKEEPKISGLEITERTVIETADSIRNSLEGGVRWMFRVSTEKEWIVFARVVAALWLLSYVGSFFDLLTLLYIGIIVGMTVPAAYVRNEDKIQRFQEWIKKQLKRLYDVVDEKFFQKVKKKVVGVKEVKEKKVE